MHIANYGMLKLSKKITKKQAKDINDALNASWPGSYEEFTGEGEDKIIFDGYVESELHCFIEEMIDIVLKPAGIVANGVIEWDGDYQGKIYVNNNDVTNLDIEETGLYEASDEELIEILEKRGYEVRKKEVA